MPEETDECHQFPSNGEEYAHRSSDFSILVALALIFYTIGVWAERLAGRPKPWHLIFFLSGLISTQPEPA